MRVISGRVVFDLVLLAGTVAGLLQAGRLPPAFGSGQIGPGDFPSIVLLLAVLALLAVLFQDLHAARTTGASQRESGVSLSAVLGVVATGGLLAGYIAFLEPLGFLVATTLFLFLAVLSCTWFLARPETRADWLRLLATAALLAGVGSVLTFLVFTYGFGLIFP